MKNVLKTIYHNAFNVNFLLIALFLATTLCVYFYYTLHQPGYWPWAYYPRLGNAFLSGHTYLMDITPDPRLLALSDAYDPWQRDINNVPYLVDGSLYRGKYYLYYGPVPALVWDIVMILFNHPMSDMELALFFACIGTLALMYLLLSLAQYISNTPSYIGIIFCLLSLAFGTWIPLVLRRSAVFEAAILGSYCFNALGLLFLWHGIAKKEKPANNTLLSIASLCFGIAVGCRISHIFNVLILGLTWLLLLRQKRLSHPFHTLFSLAIPWSSCLAAIALYNYLRFGSPFDTGWNYGLAGVNQLAPNFHMLSLGNIMPHLYLYLLRPLELTNPLTFPFYLVKEYPSIDAKLWWGYVISSWEPAYGLLSNSPFALWSLFLPYLWYQKKFSSSQAISIISSSIALYSLCMLMFISMYFYTVQRFVIDFVPWLMLISCIVYLRLLDLSAGRTRVTLLLLSGLMACYGVATGLLSGCYSMDFCK